jgi:hypothetical protein
MLLVLLYILLIIFSGFQLQMLVRDHTELSRYQGPAIPAYRWDQFKVYGTMVMYLIIIVYYTVQLYSELMKIYLLNKLPFTSSLISDKNNFTSSLISDENKKLIMDKLRALRG